MIPVVVMTGLGECGEVAHAFGGPELAGSFEAALALAAGRLDGARADGPAALVEGPVVHPMGLRGQIVLLALDHFAGRTFGHL